MIKILQKKFIVTAMTAITILLVIVIGILNVANYLNIKSSNESLIYQLAKNEQDPLLNPGNDNSTFEIPEERRLTRNDLNISQNDELAAIYFVVRVDEDGTIKQIDVERIADVSQSEAKKLYEEICDLDSPYGEIDCYKYYVVTTVFGKSYVFLDMTIQRREMFEILFDSFTAAVVAWLAMLLLVMLLSRKAIAPIAENMEKQKQFITDAGHEIKTPLAIILTNTEALELHTEETKWSRNIRMQVERLTDLTQNLLTLAKLDEQTQMLVESVNISEICTSKTQDFKEMAISKNIAFSQNIEPDCKINGNSTYINNLVSILLDNAIKYSNEGGTMDFSLHKKDKKIILSCKNTCENIETIHFENLFDRFYQNDASRSKSGFGIGLSAAKTIVEAHDGKIEAKNNDGMADFIITFKSLD